MSIVPESGFSWPVISLNKVDLPAPFGPMTPTMPPGGKVIEVKDLSKAYGDKLLFEDLSFNLPPGGIVELSSTSSTALRSASRSYVVFDDVPPDWALYLLLPKRNSRE